MYIYILYIKSDKYVKCPNTNRVKKQKGQPPNPSLVRVKIKGVGQPVSSNVRSGLSSPSRLTEEENYPPWFTVTFSSTCFLFHLLTSVKR